MTGATGSVIDTVGYDAYGAVTSESAPSVGGRLKYTGSQYDTWTNLTLDGARYYSAITRMFVSMDPTGLGPDSNPYRYAGNGPTNATDPSGLLLFADSASTASAHAKWFVSLGAKSVKTMKVGDRYLFTYKDKEEINKVADKSGDTPVRDMLKAMISGDESNIEISWVKEKAKDHLTGIAFPGSEFKKRLFDYVYGKTTISGDEWSYLKQLRVDAQKQYMSTYPGNRTNELEYGQYEATNSPTKRYIEPINDPADERKTIKLDHPNWSEREVDLEQRNRQAYAERLKNDPKFAASEADTRRVIQSWDEWFTERNKEREEKL